MAKTYNNAPYYDDYFEQQADGTLTAKPFYKVLFKPGFAIQARELNQLQSILGHQIASIGNHLFKKNANIVPGGISYNTTSDIVFLASDEVEDVQTLVGKTITNAVSFDPTDFADVENYIIAVVLAAKEATGDTPACLYVKYTNTQTDGRSTFSTNETLSTIDTEGVVTFTTHDTTGSTVGKTVSIAKGVFYTKDLFVDVDEQHIIVEADSDTVISYALIGLNIEESEVTAADDETLYDNANGSPNEYAPGADRYKVELTLAKYDINTTGLNDDNFIRLVVIENDTVTYLNNNTEYAYLMDIMAQRTFDANGNFVVRGLNTTVSNSRDDDYILGNVSRGKCYLGGYEYSQIADRSIPIEKPRSSQYQVTVPTRSQIPSTFTFFYIAGDTTMNSQPGDLVEFIPFSNDALVDSGLTPIIGTGIFRGLEYYVGTLGTKDIYKMYVDDLALTPGWTIDDIGSVRASTVGAPPSLGYVETSTVLHRLTVGTVIGEFSEGSEIRNNTTDITYTATAAGLDTENTITVTGLTGVVDVNLISPGWYVKGLTGAEGICVTMGFGYVIKVEVVDSDSVILTLNFANDGAITGTNNVQLSPRESGIVYKIRGSEFYVEKRTAAPVPSSGSFKNLPKIVDATATIPGESYTIVSTGTSDFTTIGASANTVGVTFIATAVGTGTGKVSLVPATADISEYFVSNHTPLSVPIIKIDEEPIAEFNRVDYYFIRQDEFTIGADPGTGITQELVLSTDGFPGGALSGAGDTFVSPSRRYFWGYLPDEDRYVDVTRGGADISLEADDTDYRLVLDGGSGTNEWEYWEQPIIIYSTVRRNAATAADKTKTLATVSIPTPSDSWMALGHQDVASVEKIVEGRVINITGASWAAGTPNTATVTATYTKTASGAHYNYSSGDVVVFRDIVSSLNTGGDYFVDPAVIFDGFKGYNGMHTLLTASGVDSAPDGEGLITVTVTMTYEVATDPGTYTSGGTVALEADMTNDTDVTNRYIWDSGNTSSTLGTGMIKKTATGVSGDGQIGVRYYYYEIEGEGDFVSIDSYNDGVSPDYDHVGEVADIYDPAGNPIRLRSSLDYRTRLSKLVFKTGASIEGGTNILKLKNLNLSLWQDDLVGTLVTGPSHGQDNEAGIPARIADAKFNPATGDTELYLVEQLSPATDYDAPADVDSGKYIIGMLPVAKESGYTLSLTDPLFGGLVFTHPVRRLKYSYDKFVQRQLMLFVSRGDNNLLSLDTIDVPDIYALNGYVRDSRKLPLAYIHMKPYTFSTDDVTVTKFEMPVYQMIDIHQINNKVANLEDAFSRSLNSEESGDESAIAGLGFWNEDFTNFTTPDYLSDQYTCTVYDSSYVAPGTITKTIGLQLSDINSSQRRQSGSVVTLPYTETRALGNSSGSSYTNLNPFNMIQWEGKMRLYPSVDNWIEVTGEPPSTGGSGVQAPFPPSPTDPPYTVPKEPKKEIVTEINVIKSSWGPDSSKGKHAITFEWKTNKGRTGRVNTDIHLSPGIRKHGAKGYDGTFAKSLLNRKYNDTAVKEYLQAGQHFDQKAPSEWKD